MTKETKNKKEAGIKTLERILLVTLFIILPLFEGASTNTGILLWQMITFALINVKLFQKLYLSNEGILWGRKFYFFLFPAVLGFLHFLFSVNKYNSYHAFTNLVFITLFFIFYISQISLKEIARLPLYFMPGFVLQIIVGLYQFITQPAQPVKGGFLGANYYSLYLLIGTFLMLGIVLFNKISRPLKYISVVSLAPVIFLLMKSHSRTSTGLFILMLTVLLFLKNRKLVIIGIAAILLVIVLPNPYKEHITKVHESDPYAYARIKIYRMDLNMFADNFLTGIGLGCFADFTPLYNFPMEGVIGQYRVLPRQAHNSFLHWSIETGISGLVWALLVIALVLNDITLNMIKIVKSKKPHEWNGTGPSIALLSIMAFSLVHNTLQNNVFILIFFTLAGINYRLARSNKEKNEHSSPANAKIVRIKKMPPLLWILGGVVLFYFFAYIAWYSTLKFDRALMQLVSNKPLEAVESTTASLRSLPFSTPALRTRGDTNHILFKKTGDVEKVFLSYKDYDEALKYQSRNTLLRMRKIQLLTDFQDFLREKGSVQYLKDMDMEIADLFMEMLVLRPKRAFFYRDFALYNLKQNRWDAALPLLEKAVQLEPNYVSAHRMLARVYAYLGQAEKSKEAKTKAQEIQSRYNPNEYIADEYLYNLLR